LYTTLSYNDTRSQEQLDEHLEPRKIRPEQ